MADLRQLLAELSGIGSKPPREENDDMPFVPSGPSLPSFNLPLRPRFSGEAVAEKGQKPYGDYSVGVEYKRSF